MGISEALAATESSGGGIVGGGGRGSGGGARAKGKGKGGRSPVPLGAAGRTAPPGGLDVGGGGGGGGDDDNFGISEVPASRGAVAGGGRGFGGGGRRSPSGRSKGKGKGKGKGSSTGAIGAFALGFIDDQGEDDDEHGAGDDDDDTASVASVASSQAPLKRGMSLLQSLLVDECGESAAADAKAPAAKTVAAKSVARPPLQRGMSLLQSLLVDEDGATGAPSPEGSPVGEGFGTRGRQESGMVAPQHLQRFARGSEAALGTVMSFDAGQDEDDDGYDFNI